MRDELHEFSGRETSLVWVYECCQEDPASVEPSSPKHRHVLATATRAHLDTPTIAEVAPLPARHERGEGWGEGLVPSNCRALLKSPLPDPLPAIYVPVLV